MKTVDCLIVGAGQAGLSAGYYAKQAGLEHIIIDRSQRVGDIWRKRYDSLKLFSPRFCNKLPGDKHMCGNWRGYPTKDEMANYLEEYAEKNQLRIQLGTSVQSITPQGDIYIVATDQGKWIARSVILATGGFNSPKIPSFASELPSDIMQIHSTQYQNPEQLDTSGSVVVVGGGNSGVQIARELGQAQTVYFVHNEDRKWFTNSWLIRWMGDKLGILNCSPRSLIARVFWKDQIEPIIGISKSQFLKTPHLIDCGHILTTNGKNWSCENQDIHNISTIIWATGFQQDWSWTGLEGLTDSDGNIIQEKGVTNLPGIYVLGLPRMMQKGSATVGGVGRDAKKIVHNIEQHLAQLVLT